MKYPKEDYKIRKSVVSDPGNREDVIIFLSFYTLVIYHVFISRSNKRTSKLYTKLSILDSQQCPLNFYLISYVCTESRYILITLRVSVITLEVYKTTSDSSLDLSTSVVNNLHGTNYLLNLMYR